MNLLGLLTTMPKWSLVSLFVGLLLYWIIGYFYARRSRQWRRADALTDSVVATVAFLLILRDLSGDAPIWFGLTDLPLAILSLLSLAVLAIVRLVQLKRYLDEKRSVQESANK